MERQKKACKCDLSCLGMPRLSVATFADWIRVQFHYYCVFHDQLVGLTFRQQSLKECGLLDLEAVLLQRWYSFHHPKQTANVDRKLLTSLCR